jgi:hypothetical protein
VRCHLSRYAVALAIVASLCSPAVATRADPGCPAGEAPSFALGFADLRAHVGAAMGDPVECEHVEPGAGDSYQRTTTGLALYRHDTNTPMFTNGREHWALTPEGMAHWSGWHGSAAPSGVAAPRLPDEAQAPATETAAYTRVEAVTVVAVLDDDNRRVAVQKEGATFLITTDGGCAARRTGSGEVAFVVSPGTFAGPNSRLILTLDGPECPIAEVQAY